MKKGINLNSSELSEVRKRFHKHYRLVNRKRLNDCITVNWLDLKTVVERQSGVPAENEIVLRFIHRFRDSGWFLTMECCHVNKFGIIDFVGNRFDISDFSIVDSSFSGKYDSFYQKSVSYDGVSLDKLVATKSVLIPWYQEFVEAAKVNKIAFDELIDLKFVSISYEYDAQSGLVKYPHFLAMYFSSKITGDMLNDRIIKTPGLISPFKAFNQGFPCPPKCDYFENYDLFFNNDKLEVEQNALVIN